MRLRSRWANKTTLVCEAGSDILLRQWMEFHTVSILNVGLFVDVVVAAKGHGATPLNSIELVKGRQSRPSMKIIRRSGSRSLKPPTDVLLRNDPTEGHTLGREIQTAPNSAQLLCFIERLSGHTRHSHVLA